MIRHITLLTLWLFISLLFLDKLHAQNTLVDGTVYDGDSKETLIGVQIKIKDTGEGVITDFEGNFSLETEVARPFTLTIESPGYATREFTIEDPVEHYEITLSTNRGLGDGIVVAASRAAERKFESPVSVQKMDILDIKNNPGADFYTGLAYLKGVQMNTSSLAFQSMNTRSFADAQNWRFVQVIDGVDTNLPGFGFSMGNLSGASELDVRSIEVVPGAGSALYGPNAFNGFISIDTKNPFDYPGISAYIKTGLTVQNGFDTNPYNDFGLRLAHKFSEKLAVKVNVTYLAATDWGAQDESYIIANEDVPFKDYYLGLPRNNPTYNAVHVYGDEVHANVDLGDGTLSPISRTGFRERDIIDYGIGNLKVSGAIHYRPTDNVELIYDLKYSENDAILRHTWFFPMVGLKHQLHRFEAKGAHTFVRAYYSQQHTNNAYSILAGSMFLQEQLKTTPLWGADYGAAYRGEVAGVVGGDHDIARIYADRDMPQPGDPDFMKLMPLLFRNDQGLPGVATFSDLSQSFNIEAGFDVLEPVSGINIQVGANYRRYWLDSEGRLYNDSPNGFGRSIRIFQYGAYTQASRSLFNNRLALRASARIDDHRNFDLRFTPRASMVLTLDEKRNHNIRVSAQTAFRNAAPQEAYLAMDVGLYVILGGTLHNLYNYRYDMGDGQLVKGRDIIENLYTPASYEAYVEGGSVDPSLLQKVNIEALKPERVTSYEIGYRGLFREFVYLDINFYRNIYYDLASSTVAHNPETHRRFAIQSNVANPIYSTGLEAGVEFALPKGMQLGMNYTYTVFDATEAVKNDARFLPSFNSPNSRFNILLGSNDIWNGMGFNIKYRWSEGYTWQSGLGQGDIASYGVMDAAVSYKVSKWKSTLKLGASNLLNTPYRTIYGGPYVGGLYYMSVVFDSFVP